MTNALVISAMHTGTQWLVGSLRAAGVEVRGAHTFGPWRERMKEYAGWPVLVPIRDPALAMISFENRQPQSGRCQAEDFEIVRDLVRDGATPILVGARETLEEVVGRPVPDVGVRNASEDRTGWKKDYLETGRLHGWVAEEVAKL